MRNGSTYANVHSTKWPGGEIRAQIKSTTLAGGAAAWRKGARRMPGPLSHVPSRLRGGRSQPRPNAAARAPSTTRWSNVIAIVPCSLTTTSPSRTTARGAMRPTLRIATSGWLTIGVWKRPASFPALETVKVESRTSSARDRAARARPRRAARSRRGSRRPFVAAAADDRHDEPLLRLHRDPDVAALEVDDVVAVEARVQLGELCERVGARLDDRCEQLHALDRAEVALLDPGDRRHLTVRARHVLGDHASNPAQRLAATLDGSRGGSGRRPR